jgi:uncharacterized protein (TIRG00374 family)
MTNLWKSVLKWLPGTVISLLLVALILHYVNLGAVWIALGKADVRLLALALAGSICFLLVRAIIWRTLLQNRPSYLVTFFCMSEGYLMNNFLPFRLGEVGRVFLLSRKTDMRFMEILPTVVVERVMDLFFSAAILVVSVPFVLGVSGADRIGYIVGSLVLAVLIGLFVLVKKRVWALEIFHKLSLRWPKLQKVGGSLLESFFEGLAVLTDYRLFLRFLFWMTMDWTIATVQYFILILAFFPQARLTWAMFSLGVAAFGNAIPSLPGAIGTLDGAVVYTFTVLKQNIDTAAALVVVMRLFNYLSTGVPALFALSREGQTLAGLYRDVSNFRSKTHQDGKPE